MISIDLKLVGEEEFVLRLDTLPEKVREVVEAKFSTLIEALRNKVADNLSGAVLQTKSGALLESLKSGVEQIGSTAIGFVEIDPPNERVKTYALANEYGGKAWYIIPLGLKGVLANKEERFFSRRAVMHPPAIERSYLRSAFREMEEPIIQGLSSAVEEALR